MVDQSEKGTHGREGKMLLTPNRFGLPSRVLLAHDLLAFKEHVELAAFAALTPEEQSTVGQAVERVLDTALTRVTASYDARKPERAAMQDKLESAMLDEIAKRRANPAYLMHSPVEQGQADRAETITISQLNLLKGFYVDGEDLKTLAAKSGEKGITTGTARTNLRNARKRILKPLLMGTFGYGMENDEDVKVLRAFVLKVFQDDPSLLRGSGILDSLPRRFANSLDVDPTAHRRSSAQSLAVLNNLAELASDRDDESRWDVDDE